MHKSSLDKMAWFVEQYLSGYKGVSRQILDLGSYDVNGSYRDFFADSAWHYQGMDMEAGKNVDIVLHNPYAWKEIKSKSMDVLISGQAFEHVEFFWVLIDEMARVLKPGGLICIIAPSRGYEHRYPVDCWRFYPDAFRALARYAGLELLHVETQWDNKGYTVDDSDAWGDTIAVMRRPEKWAFRFKAILALRKLINYLSV
ncbi:MAG: methyltransferase domain-containing protein [Methylococcaceae bacterium]|nr:methyltransferase domain-containing protein [Methylococcaceae bacterium]